MEKHKIIYFDNAATTRVDDEVLKIMNEYQTEKYFNPSSLHAFSLAVSRDVVKAREQISTAAGCNANNLVFTSCGSEADNMILRGALKSPKGNIVTSAAEHSAVYNTSVQLKNSGYELRLAKLLPNGQVDIEDLIKLVDNETLLVSIMNVNNETGAINDVGEIARKVKKVNYNTLVMSDGVQAFGKIPVNLNDIKVDFYTFSAHKIHCTKGIGAVYAKNPNSLRPLIFGGGQEKGLRSGTENVAGIMGFGYAAQLAVANLEQNTEKFLQYKTIIKNKLSQFDGIKYICEQNCSPAILTFAVKGIKSQVLLNLLEQEGIIIGLGSACNSHNKQNRIMQAINLEKEYIEGVVRVSFSKFNTESEVVLLAEKLATHIAYLRNL